MSHTTRAGKSWRPLSPSPQLLAPSPAASPFPLLLRLTNRQMSIAAPGVTSQGDTVTPSHIGPLTTIITPPAPCLTEFWPTDRWLELGVRTRTDCFPSGLQTTAPSFGYFSPGICPASYTQAQSLESWWLGAGETGSYCCPRYTRTSRPP